MAYPGYGKILKDFQEIMQKNYFEGVRPEKWYLVGSDSYKKKTENLLWPKLVGLLLYKIDFMEKFSSNRNNKWNFDSLFFNFEIFKMLSISGAFQEIV